MYRHRALFFSPQSAHLFRQEHIPLSDNAAVSRIKARLCKNCKDFHQKMQLIVAKKRAIIYKKQKRGSK